MDPAGASNNAKPASPPFSADPPQPPNWEGHLIESYSSRFYQKFPVEPGSKEFTILETLMPTLKVTSVEQVINPDLWHRFTNARRDMFVSKINDANVLKGLGLGHGEIARCAVLAASHKRDPQPNLEDSKYSPNEALLFHCTRNEESIEKILRQGLDDRLGPTGRLLGKGIYFSCDPAKSTQYDQSGGHILVFQVLLGDCLSVDRHPSKYSLVREPEKVAQQARTYTDQFFDSITGRPKKPYNEYVIFDRLRCCPMYLVKYEQKKSPKPGAGKNAADTNGLSDDLKTLAQNCADARQEVPTIAWTAKTISRRASDIPKPNPQGTWPFSASYLFEMMGDARGGSPDDMDMAPDSHDTSSSTKKVPLKSSKTATRPCKIPPTSPQVISAFNLFELSDMDNGAGAPDTSSSTKKVPIQSTAKTPRKNPSTTAQDISLAKDLLVLIKENLEKLKMLGFRDQKLNIKTLEKFDNNFDLAIKYIRDKDSKVSTTPSTSKTAPKSNSIPGNAPSNSVRVGTPQPSKTVPSSPSKVMEILMSASATALASNIINVASPAPPTSSTSSSSENTRALVNDLLAQLEELGFSDDKQNREALKRCGNVLDDAVNYILDKRALSSATSGSDNDNSPKPSTFGSVPSNMFGKAETEPIIDLVSSSSSEKAESLVPYMSCKTKRRKKTPRTLTNRYSSSSSEEEGLELDSNSKPKRTKVAAPAAEENESCSICYEDYPAFSHSPSSWVKLNCGPRICKSCHKNTEKTGTTMSGVEHTFSRCPFCQEITGTQVGDCPDGQMNVKSISQRCEGYPGDVTIKIDYIIKSKKLNRTAYLPKNAEGEEILKLLETAWDRRLCFRIGTSLTSGRQNVPVWNIHHKTSREGGPPAYGYPDQGYFERVKSELKAFGIE